MEDPDNNPVASTASQTDPTEAIVEAADDVSKKNLVIHADEAAFVKSTTSDASSKTDASLHSLAETMTAMRGENKRDFENLLTVLQEESTRRASMEQRFHSQLLLQNEYMVAMELKLLRLEAKVERREALLRRQQQQPYSHSGGQRNISAGQHHVSSLHENAGANSNNPQPILYTNYRLPSASTTIHESNMEVPCSSPRSPTLASSSPALISHHHHHHTTSNMTEEEEEPPPPTMAAVNISSGASLASGVTAGSFLGEDDDDDDSNQRAERDDGDDNGDDDDDAQSDPVIREVGSQHSSK